MKSINFILLIVLLSTFLGVNGQEREPESWLRVIPQEYSSLTQPEVEKIEKLVEKGIYSDYWIVDSYALKNIIQNNELAFSLPGQRIKATYSQSWLGDDANGHVVWEGKTKEEDGYAILLMDERTVFGHIKYQGEDFMIHSMEESNTSVIVKQVKSDNTGSRCGAPSPLEDEKAPIQSETPSNGRLGATSNCDIRVLVQYTQEAANVTINITQLGLLGIAESNSALINSNISRNTVSFVSAGVELLSTIPNNWPGPDISDDVDALIQNQSGFGFNGANDRRELTGADIVVCLTDNIYFDSYWNDLVGAVTVSGLTFASSAYTIIEAPSAIGDYIFAHMVAHLLDCRDSNDNSGFSYARGHFYYGNDGEIYGTILGINTSNMPTYTIPYYSNPNISHKGAPTGNALRNNARRIRDRACTVANYLSSVNNPLSAAVQGATSAYSGSYNTFQADVSGGGPGAYSYQWRISNSPVPSGTLLSTSTQLSTQLVISQYSATKYIHLKVTSADGQVRNDVHPVYIYGGIGPPPPNRIGALSELGVYPNPASNKVILSLDAAEEGQAKVLLYNALGKVVQEESFYHKSGSMQYKYNISDLTAGVYLVMVQIGDQKFTKKLVKAN